MLRPLGTLVGLVCAAAFVGSAESVEGQDRAWTPDDGWTWSVRRDDGAGGDPIRIETVGEGWTLTTGASSILYRGAERLSPPYRVEVDFEGTDPMRRNEGYGIVFGGHDLGGPGQTYSYVLIRQDGMMLVKRRAEEDTYVVENWTRVGPLRSWADRDTGAEVVRNRLALDVAGGRVRIEVNGTEVLDLPVGSMPVAGAVGLRVNHGLRIGVRGMTVSGG